MYLLTDYLVCLITSCDDGFQEKFSSASFTAVSINIIKKITIIQETYFLQVTHEFE